MKRLLLALCVLLSLPILADTRTKTSTFDFSNPESLSPAITRNPDGGGGLVDVTGKTFTSSDANITIHFDNSKVSGRYPIYIQNIANVCNLRLDTSAELIVTANNGIRINSVRFPGSDVIEGLTLVAIGSTSAYEFLSLDDSQAYYIWNNPGTQSFSSLSFSNKVPAYTQIHQVLVDYELPSEVLSVQSATIANNSTIHVFDGIQLTFADNMTVTNDAQCTLSDGTHTTELTATANGKVVTVAPANAITEDGTYTLTVKARSFADSEGFYNKEWTCKFTIIRSFDILSVAPSAGSVDDIPSTITLTFGGTVGSVNGNMNVDVLDADGVLKRRGHASNGTEDNQVIITFDNTTPITSNGIYTLVIPEGLVTDVAGKHQNEKTTYDYNIGHIASDELKAYAQQLLAYTGIGYPKSNAAARAVLASMPANSSTSAYNTAIANYLQTTDVEMPVSGDYYYLKAVAKDGGQMFVKYANGLVSLTSSVDDAVPLRVEGSAGSYSFITPDNKYLMLLAPSSGVTNSANNLTLAKLAIAGVADEDVFGLFSLYGGFNGGNTYALVNMTGTFATDSGLGLSYFTPTLTNGFALETVPEGNIPVGDAAYTLTPTSGTSSSQLTSVTISFPNISQVTLANKNLIKLTRSDNTQVNPSSVSLVAGKTNEYVLTFVDVRSGDYTLTFGKGAFTYNHTLSNGHVITAAVQTIVATYRVTTGDDYQYDFTQKYNIYPVGAVTLPSPIKDSDLNNLTFYSNDTKIGVSDKVVNIVNYNTADIVGYGVLRPVAADTLYPNAKGIVKLEMTKKIEEGSLPAAQYSFIIYEGTFGDENFGDYNADPAKFLATGKTKADCHTNPYIYYIVDVNNSQSGQDPTPQEDHPSIAVLNKAKELLAKTGVGYPTENASSRTILQDLVKSNIGTDEVFNNAMLAYLGESDIQKPVSGKYYQIVGVSTTDQKVYVQADGTITSDASKAAPFMAITNGNGTSFTALNGKYLTVLTSVDNLTTTANTLTLGGMPVGNNLMEKAFGKMTIMGTKDGVTLMAKVNTTIPAITTSDNSFVFDSEETSGFLFIEVDPTVIPAPTPDYTLSPESGAIVASNFDVLLTFTNLTNVTLADKDKIYITKDGQTMSVLSVEALNDHQFSVACPVSDGTELTLHFAEGAFTYKFLERTEAVQAISAKYILNLRPAEETLAQAQRELAKAGLVGYPTTDSDAYKTLYQLVGAGLGTTATFSDAIAAFKAETNVEMPATGKFYKIYARSTEKLCYLRYADDAVSLITDATKASPFMATVNADGTTSLMTIDGKYLTLLSMTGSNVSESPVDLTIARLAGNELSPADTYGLLSMSGANGFSTVDASALAFRNPMRSPVLKPATTSGFVFVEVDKESIVMPDIEYTLSPEQGMEVESLEKVTLTFNTKVTLTDKNQIKLEKFSGEIYTPITVEQTKDNEFVFTFINLKKDTYKLTIDKGAFTTTFLDEQRPVQAITANYTLTKSVEFVAGYEKEIQLSWAEDPQSDYMMDTELNTFTLVSSVPLSFNPDKAVVIRNHWSGEEVARGYMKSAAQVRSNAEGIVDYSYSLVLEKPIVEGSLASTTYEYVFDKETFGDTNYGEYLVEPTKVSKANCHVNDKIIYEVKVDNAKAAVVALAPVESPVSGSVDNLTVVTLTFNTDQKVTLANQSLITLELSGGTAVAPKSIKQVGDNAFELTFDNLDKGTYNLIVGTGAFTTTYRGKERQVEKFSIFYYLTTPTGIREIGADANGTPVYDVYGRKVSGQLKKGQVYIKNGKKFIKK